MLEEALTNLQTRGLLDQLETFQGSWVIRPTRGSSAVSAHGWGIAIDINAPGNYRGQKPSMSPDFVKAFTDAGFTWGGTFSTPDGMHFSTGF